SVPTIALAIPLPGSPTGLGLLTKKLRLSSRTPVTAMYARMTTSAPITKAANMPVIRVIQLLSILRRRRLYMRHLALAAGHAPHKQSCQRVDREGYDEQYQAKLDQRIAIDLGRGFSELVCNGRRDGERRIEQRSGNPG